MPRARFAVVAAVALSMVPVSAPAVAMPYLGGSAIIAGQGSSLVEVSRRHKKKYRRSCRRKSFDDGYGCRSRKYVHRHRHHRHHHVSGCIWFNGLRICF